MPATMPVTIREGAGSGEVKDGFYGFLQTTTDDDDCDDHDDDDHDEDQGGGHRSRVWGG